VFDDHGAVTQNADVTNHDRPMSQLFVNDYWGTSLWDRTSHKSYRPVTVMTFRLNHHFFGMEVVSYHAVNVVLHAVVSVLVYMTATMFFSSGCSLATGLLFAVHSVHVDAVASVAGRAELLSAVFFFISFMLYITACTRDHMGLVTLSMLCAAVSMLCKEQGLLVIGMCLVYDVLVHCKLGFRASSPFWVRLRHLVVCAAALALLALRGFLLGGSMPKFQVADNPASFSPNMWTRVLTFNYLYSLNAWLLVFPWTLCCDWAGSSIPLVTAWADPRNLGTLAFYACAALAFKLLHGAPDKERPLLVVGFAMITVPFLPSMNIFFRVGFVLAERILYIPSAGYCMILAWCLEKLAKSGHGLVSKAVFVSVLLFLSGRTVVRNEDWKSMDSLFTSALSATPLNQKVLLYHAHRAFRRDVAATSDLCKQVLEVDHYNAMQSSDYQMCGRAEMAFERYAEAETYFHAAVRKYARDPAAHWHLAHAYHKHGNEPKAKLNLEKCIKAYKKLKILPEEGEEQRSEDDARRHHETVNEYHPLTNTYMHRVGAMYLNWQNYTEASKYFNLVLLTEPENESTLMESSNAFMGMEKFDEALEHLTKLHNLTNSEYPGLAGAFGTCYLRMDLLLDAQNHLRSAIALEPESARYTVFLAVAIFRALGGNHTEARELALKARQLAPDDYMTVQNVNYVLQEQ
jgi:tetratricopeptide (TPR) repeat protein